MKINHFENYKGYSITLNIEYNYDLICDNKEYTDKLNDILAEVIYEIKHYMQYFKLLENEMGDEKGIKRTIKNVGRDTFRDCVEKVKKEVTYKSCFTHLKFKIKVKNE